jgi:hypothetical protein
MKKPIAVNALRALVAPWANRVPVAFRDACLGGAIGLADACSVRASSAGPILQTIASRRRLIVAAALHCMLANGIVDLAMIGSSAPAAAAGAEMPDAIAVTRGVPIATLRAQGAQIYECKADTSGKLTWQFREPVAALFDQGGDTIGRHYAGPNWELADGSAVVGKVTGRAPGATANDIPVLKLEVTSRRGTGRLAHVATIQRLNTRGGVADGPCGRASELHSVPYSADYVFYENPR